MSKSFVERPKIPSMTEIAKDLEEAPTDDVVLQKLNFVSSHSSSIANGASNEESDIDADDENNRLKLEKLNAEISEACSKARQMVKLCEILHEAPSKLEHEYKDLEHQGLEVSSAIEDLRRSSQTAPSPPTKQTSKKKKGKK
ncbi:hypothetical protein SNE40_023282 [Patella caerulea]|uniref:Uncharacterized protein n=1 Tax=Patella caerulea TaxID=87958 RepID=A0AAN8IVY0_PATCE